MGGHGSQRRVGETRGAPGPLLIRRQVHVGRGPPEVGEREPAAGCSRK